MAKFSDPDYGVIADRHKQVIGVVGVGSGAGSTFAAMGLAVKMAGMSKGVTFVEGAAHGPECRSPYGILAVTREFREKRFVEFFDEASEAGERAGGGRPGLRTNLYHKVNWVVRGPAATGASAPDCRLLPGSHIIVDNPEEPEDMDLIICVVDPLPSRIMAGLETFRRIREQSMVPVIWVMNKANPAAARRRTENFLKVKFTHTIPLLTAESFYKAEYDCAMPPFDQASEAFRSLAEEILLHN